MKDGLMISISGIRGVFGASLTPDIVMRYAACFGIYSRKKRKARINEEKRGKEITPYPPIGDVTTIVIGRDSRTTGKTLNYAVRSALLGIGCNVIDIGITATPTFLWAVKKLKADGGICITASHNPAHWNALKLSSYRGMFLFPEEAEDLFSTYNEPVEYAGWDKQGHLFFNNDMTESHINKLLNIPYINYQKIKAGKDKSLSCPYKVVIDSVNGAGGLISPALLRRLGCEVVEINSEPTGYFAHKPEPLNENLTQLKEAVVEHKADIGFATDPDVDRLSIVSEKGEAIGEELSLVLASKYVLNHKAGDIVTNCSTTMAIDDIAESFGVKVHRTKVGEINVAKKMIEINAAVGGEGNGGVICPEINYTRDAPAGMVLILGLLAEENSSLSALVDRIPKYYITKDKIEATTAVLNDALVKAEQKYSGEKIDKTDGLKIIGDKYWIHIRKSGTEPILRIYVESDSQERSDNICRDARESLTS